MTKQNEKLSFGQTLHRIRRSKDKTQREIATTIEMDFSYFSRLENDRFDSKPTRETIDKIATAMECSAEERDELLAAAGRVDLTERLRAEEELNVKNAASASLRVAKLEAEIMGMRAEITKWKERLSSEMERNLNNVANAQLQIETLTSEYQTWREACGKARERADAAQAEITRLCEGQKIHNCEAAEAQIVELEKDEAILDWMADNNLLEGFVHVDYDVHEVALWIAEERSADAEPTVEDYRLALRRLIRAAMDEEHQYIKDLQGEEAAHIKESLKGTVRFFKINGFW